MKLNGNYVDRPCECQNMTIVGSHDGNFFRDMSGPAKISNQGGGSGPVVLQADVEVTRAPGQSKEVCLQFPGQLPRALTEFDRWPVDIRSL